MPIVSGKALGQRRPLFADWSWPLSAEVSRPEGTPLRTILDRVVRDQVEAFRQRQQEDQLVRVLTAREVDEAAERGRITMGQSEAGQQLVDPDAAVATALQAFQDGLFLVVVDGIDYTGLDQLVPLQAESRITFIRLTLLAGG